MGLLLNEEGNLVTQDIAETEVLNSFFTSVFTREIGLQECQVPKTGGKSGTKTTYP